jgi:hypothetical protein
MSTAADRIKAAMQAEEAELKKRNAEIARRVRAGEPKMALAREFRLSRSRVDAIVGREALRASTEEPGAGDAA